MAPTKPPANFVPQPLAPSVEEAYRRKCCYLRHRTNEIEEANQASRVRLSRLSRQIDKLRLERAFLLEQLAKRTSLDVEDSDGSPSPPLSPDEKHFKTKKPSRPRPSGVDAGDISVTLSPSRSKPKRPSKKALATTATNSSLSTSDPNKTASTYEKATIESASAVPNAIALAFETFSQDARPRIQLELTEAEQTPSKEDDSEEKQGEPQARAVEDELVRSWNALSAEEQSAYREKAHGDEETAPSFAVQATPETEKTPAPEDVSEARDADMIDADTATETANEGEDEDDDVEMKTEE